jgi:hypothetical protein
LLQRFARALSQIALVNRLTKIHQVFAKGRQGNDPDRPFACYPDLWEMPKEQRPCWILS